MIAIYLQNIGHMGGAEKVCFQMADYYSRVKGEEVHIFHQDPDYSEPHELFNKYLNNKVKIIKSMWIGTMVKAIKENNYRLFINHSDWRYQVYEEYEEISKYTRIYHFEHSGFFSGLRYYTTIYRDLMILRENTKQFIYAYVALNDSDYHSAKDAGYPVVRWDFGVDAVENLRVTSDTYSKVICLASNWERGFKNFPEAKKMLLELDSEMDVSIYGKGAYIPELNLSKQFNHPVDINVCMTKGSIIFHPSFFEQRPLTLIEAFLRDIPVVCYKKWVDLPNVIVAEDFNDAKKIILSLMKGRKVDSYSDKLKQKQLFEFSMTEFEDLKPKIETDKSSDAYQVCTQYTWRVKDAKLTNLYMTENFVNSNVPVCGQYDSLYYILQIGAYDKPEYSIDYNGLNITVKEVSLDNLIEVLYKLPDTIVYVVLTNQYLHQVQPKLPLLNSANVILDNSGILCIQRNLLESRPKITEVRRGNPAATMSDIYQKLCDSENLLIKQVDKNGMKFIRV